MGRAKDLDPTITTLEGAYEFFSVNWSDCHEHMATFVKYGAEVEHITEFGVRTGRSTVAWLTAKPKFLICYDIELNPKFPLALYQAWAIENNLHFEFIVHDTLTVDIQPTDLLFVDTIHSYTQVKAELYKHHTKVKKYIVLHDTEVFGLVGMDNQKPGLIKAIADFISQHPEWTIDVVYKNNNGLTILKRT